MPDCWSNYNLGLIFIEKNSINTAPPIRIAQATEIIIPMMSVFISGFATTIGGIGGIVVFWIVLLGIIVIAELFYELDGGGGATAGGGATGVGVSDGGGGGETGVTGGGGF